LYASAGGHRRKRSTTSPGSGGRLYYYLVVLLFVVFSSSSLPPLRGVAPRGGYGRISLPPTFPAHHPRGGRLPLFWGLLPIGRGGGSACGGPATLPDARERISANVVRYRSYWEGGPRRGCMPVPEGTGGNVVQPLRGRVGFILLSCCSVVVVFSPAFPPSPEGRGPSGRVGKVSAACNRCHLLCMQPLPFIGHGAVEGPGGEVWLRLRPFR